MHGGFIFRWWISLLSIYTKFILQGIKQKHRPKLNWIYSCTYIHMFKCWALPVHSDSLRASTAFHHFLGPADRAVRARWGVYLCFWQLIWFWSVVFTFISVEWINAFKKLRWRKMRFKTIGNVTAKINEKKFQLFYFYYNLCKSLKGWRMNKKVFNWCFAMRFLLNARYFVIYISS